MALKTFEYKVIKKSPQMRLDLVLVDSGIDLSRRKIRKIIDIGGVYLNRKRVRVASKPIKIGDSISLSYNLEMIQGSLPPQILLRNEDILFYDQGIIAINKPPGLASQETRDQSVMHAKTCLVKLLKDQGEKVPHLTLLHRLDKETSGILLFAYDDKVGAAVLEAFKGRTIKKEYHAICNGIAKAEMFEVKCYLTAIDKKLGIVRKVNSGGKSSATSFNLLSKSEKYRVSLLQCFPETGRSHQIRAHLELEGLPIVGDKRYGQNKKNSLSESLQDLTSRHHMLHARKIKFEVLGRDYEIEAPYPPGFIGMAAIFPDLEKYF